MMRDKFRKPLQQALSTGVIVKIERSCEKGGATGYILDVGPEFFLVALVSENIHFNGFQAYRIRDVSDLEVPHQYAAFVEEALALRQETRPPKPPVSMADLPKLLRSAAACFPLVTIHCETLNPEVCHIGRVQELNAYAVTLQEIGPHACWEDATTEYALADITRVDFGGDYEEALWLVAQARHTTGETA